MGFSVYGRTRTVLLIRRRARREGVHYCVRKQRVRPPKVCPTLIGHHRDGVVRGEYERLALQRDRVMRVGCHQCEGNVLDG